MASSWTKTTTLWTFPDMASKPLSKRNRVTAFRGEELFPVTRDGETMAGSIDVLAQFTAPLVPIAQEVLGLADEAAASASAAQEIAQQFGDVAGAVTQATIQAGIAGSSALAAGVQAALSTAKAAEASARASAADAARAAAEAARDALNTTGKVFTAAEGTAAGIVATANGQQFAVLSTDSLTWLVYRNNAGAALPLSGSYTKAYVDQLADLTDDRYYRGKRIMFGRVGASNRIGDVITEDGQHYAKYAIRGGNSSISISRAADGFFEVILGLFDSLTFNSGAVVGGTTDFYYGGKRVVSGHVDASNRIGNIITEDGQHYANYALRGKSGVTVTRAKDGFFEIAVGGSFDALNFNGGAAIGGVTDFYYAGKKVVGASADASNRGGWVLTEDGTVYIPKLVSPALDGAGSTAPLETADFVFEVATVGGKQQIRRTKKISGVRSAAASLGNNSAPRLSADGAKIIYSTDRNGAREGYYQLLAGTKLGGAIEHPVVPRPSLMPLGDSLTAGDYAALVAAAFGMPLLVPSSDASAGIGSQNSTQIAARYGALALTCSLSGNTMGAVANYLTAISVHLIARVGDQVGTVRSLRASILGITGTLTSTQSATSVPNSITFGGQWYTYTFTPDAGQTLPGTVPAGTALVIDPEARQDSVLLVWMGRNDVGAAGWQDTVKANIAAVVAAYKPLVRRICILSITNAVAEPIGTANYDQIVAFNADIAALYPDSYVDVRAAYNAGTATDIPAAANTSDGVHYTTAGKTAIAGAVISFITSKGWYA